MQELNAALRAVGLATKIILESGGETYRAEETAERMCAGLGYARSDVLAIPTGVFLTLYNSEEQCFSRVVRVRARAINLSRIDMVNAVSRKVACGEMNAQQAYERLQAIARIGVPKQWVMVTACALSSALFSLMLGGGYREFLASMVCGALSQGIVPLLRRLRVPAMLSCMICGALVAIVAMLSTLVFPCNTESVISGAIMPLVPGLAMTNAIRDTIRGDLVSGGARGTEALLSAVMLAAGVFIVLSLWGGAVV